jgi:type I restriction enzyme R subunit
MTHPFLESEVEEAALEWFAGLGWAVANGLEIAPGEPAAERTGFEEVTLNTRLKAAIARLNPSIPGDAQDEAFRKVVRLAAPSLTETNRAFHRMLVDGVEVEYRRADGSIAGDHAKLVDFENPDANDWLAVNQFTVIEKPHNRRPDIVLFVNGLPLAVIELKNAADEDATIWNAFQQLQTYKAQIPSLFAFNEALVISDGLEARVGTLTADRERFMPWRTVDGKETASAITPQLETLIHGLFGKSRFLDMLRHFIVFEDSGDGQPEKKMAGYHQFHAVNQALETTITASGTRGDRRCGVVWHTQGSGKSLTMVFYAGRVILHPAMENPTIVVLTDRNDLDDQLFGVFSRCHEILRQSPVQAADRSDLRNHLSVASGGVVFTTIQKFLPEGTDVVNGGAGTRPAPTLSDRRNIVVIADEAHRSQYDFIDGYARHMRDALPNASFIGFTGTPLEKADKNTRAVFGDHISVYDIQRAVDDGATVRIYYESRLAKLELIESERPKIDADFEEATEGEETDKKEKLKTKWAALEGVVGSDKRVRLIARDLVDHFEKRREAMDGKAMVVCMSRRICMDLHDEIVKLRPTWYQVDDALGTVKVVMTGNASEGPRVAEHARNKPRREALAKRFKDPSDSFKIVIVRDMWLTGFDAPCLHTMYLDKPMRGHGLMQAIARVNRVFRDKPGGLVVDYLGLAQDLKLALADYTENGGKGDATFDQAEAVAVMTEKYEVCCGLFAGFDWSVWAKGRPTDRLRLLPAAQEKILAQEDGKARCLRAVTELSQAFALAVPHEDALRIRDDVAFFQAVRAALAKSGESEKKQSPEDIERAIRQIVSRAVSSDEVVDVFAAAGLKKPDISILSDEFLAEVQGMDHKNLAVELLRKLLNDEIKTRSRKFLVQSRSFSELLERSIKTYQSRAIEAAQVIEELIALAKDMRDAGRRGDNLGLNEDELAFYDALEVNDSAVKILGDETLRTIARELVDTVKRNVSIDWTVKESVRAKLRVIVKRVLRKYGYPPDKQEKATQTVLEQAELICGEEPVGEEAMQSGTGARPTADIMPFPFRRIDTPEAKARWKTCVPIYTLKAAAGAFSTDQTPEPDGWAEIESRRALTRDMFVAQVIGKSMVPLIPDGAWCLFTREVAGSRYGRTLLIQSSEWNDLGGGFTIKKYGRPPQETREGEARAGVVLLHPANPEFEPIPIDEDNADQIRVIAEFLQIISR